MNKMEYRITLAKKHKNSEEITELNLNYCYGTAIVGLTQEFVNLKDLSLRGVGLTSLSGLPPLPNLKVIDLSSNAISNGLEFLLLSPNLFLLNLKYNKIADEDELTPLSNLDHLVHLHLLGNPLTEKKGYMSIVSGKVPELKYLDSVLVELIRSSNKETIRKNSQVQPKPKANLKKAVIIGGGVLTVVGTGLAAVAAAPFVISAAGFTAAGVAAGSVAAAVQSSIGAVAAGGLFASLQSAGVVGLAVGTNAAIGATAGVAGGGIYVAKLLSKKKSVQGSANTESGDDAEPGDDKKPDDSEKPDGKTTYDK